MVWERTSSINKTDLFCVSWYSSTDVSRILCIHSSHRSGLREQFLTSAGIVHAGQCRYPKITELDFYAPVWKQGIFGQIQRPLCQLEVSQNPNLSAEQELEILARSHLPAFLTTKALCCLCRTTSNDATTSSMDLVPLFSKCPRSSVILRRSYLEQLWLQRHRN